MVDRACLRQMPPSQRDVQISSGTRRYQFHEASNGSDYSNHLLACDGVWPIDPGTAMQQAAALTLSWWARIFCVERGSARATGADCLRGRHSPFAPNYYQNSRNLDFAATRDCLLEVAVARRRTAVPFLVPEMKSQPLSFH